MSYSEIGNEYRPKLSKHELILERYKTLLLSSENNNKEIQAQSKKESQSFTMEDTQLKKIETMLIKNEMKRDYLEGKEESVNMNPSNKIDLIKRKYGFDTRKGNNPLCSNISNIIEPVSNTLEKIKAKYSNKSNDSIANIQNKIQQSPSINRTLASGASIVEEKLARYRQVYCGKEIPFEKIEQKENQEEKINVNASKEKEKTLPEDNQLLLSKISLIEEKMSSLQKSSSAKKLMELESPSKGSSDEIDCKNQEENEDEPINERQQKFKLELNSPAVNPPHSNERYSHIKNIHQNEHEAQFLGINYIINSCLNDITGSLFEKNIVDNKNETIQTNLKGKIIKLTPKNLVKKALITFDEFLKHETSQISQ